MRTYAINTDNRQRQVTAVVQATLNVDEIGPWLARAYHDVASLVATQGVPFAGAPFARYHRIGQNRFTVEAGFPTTAAVTPSDGVQTSSLPAGPTATTFHIGPYDQLEHAYTALVDWIRDHRGEPVGDGWEVYYTDPQAQPDPSTWRTEVVQPYRQTT